LNPEDIEKSEDEYQGQMSVPALDPQAKSNGNVPPFPPFRKALSLHSAGAA
jgi:hypothetical protein